MSGVLPESLTRVHVAPELTSFREVARGLLARGVPPERVLFVESAEGARSSEFSAGARGPEFSAGARGSEFSMGARVSASSSAGATGSEPADLDAARTPGTIASGMVPPPVTASVPRDFLALAEAVACHRSPERWGLLYRVLWRLTRGERGLLERSRDEAVARLREMERAVGRDAHVLLEGARFRRVASDEGERFVAWFRPEHRIVRYVAPRVARRFAFARWSLLTPDASAHWDAGQLRFEAGVSDPGLPEPRARGAEEQAAGEGDGKVSLMLVRERPGDEDANAATALHGSEEPLLGEVLARARLRRSALHVTWVPRHAEEAECRTWLESEVATVRPRMVVALGEGAARAFLGPSFRFHLDRGRLLRTPWAEAWMATFDPAEVLRLAEPRARAEARIHFEADLRSAAEWMRGAGRYMPLTEWGR
ncbi:DUF4130 domain-containing protein [Myxococcaceae bacterium JPH2]|nr:DUF4130 domain-containing protein [Myxococcaceae bacterium JPH2]